MLKTIESYTYKISQHIGKGYSSTVHKAINDKTGQQVSIKVIEMSKLEDPINQMLLQHQITALKKLSFSPGVLHLYDVYATKNNTYIVTELCEGDLGALLKRRKCMAYGEAVEIVRQVVNGYVDVYNVGYLHRDIKPANIFYKGNAYKIGDFGFAIPKTELSQHKTYNVGSPVYMPPQALKDNQYSVSCDTWAIGIILYQLIKGVVPWRAISEQKLHGKMLSEPLEELTVGLPEVARAFLARVLHLDPGMRMTVQEMGGWMGKLAAGEGMGLGNMVPCSPLKEIKNQGNMLTIPSPSNLEIKPILTPKQLPSNPFRFHPALQPPPTQKHLNSHSSTQYFARPTSYPNPNPGAIGSNIGFNPSAKDLGIGGNNENQIMKPLSITNFNPSSTPNSTPTLNPPTLTPSTSAPPSTHPQPTDQPTKHSKNILNHLKFLHRVLKFLEPPTLLELPQLVSALTGYLFAELERYGELVRSPGSCGFVGWEQFLGTGRGVEFKGKLGECGVKYGMFHRVGDRVEVLTQQLLMQSIKKLLSKLEQQPQFMQQTPPPTSAPPPPPTTLKSLISLDYLTTLYQLFHLKNKHTLKDFFRMSKIDMIVEGSPYGVGVGHLGQIRRKLMLIDVVE